MIQNLAADTVLLVHLGFVLFVVFGGLLLFRWPRSAFFHLPAAIWGILIEFSGWISPLTPLKQQFREAAGEAAWQESFVEHYLVPRLYPEQLDRSLQHLGTLVLLGNVTIYALVLARKRYKERGIVPDLLIS